MKINILYNKITLYSSININGSSIGPKINIQNAHLCKLYETFGFSLPKKINGDFAFALYDQDKKRYFCARDPFSVNELYFTNTESSYHFSDNIEDLISLPHVEKNPNLQSMKTMLYHRALDYNSTMYENIFRIPPGHFMLIENGKKVLERYWYPEEITINYAMSEDEITHRLYSLLKNAIYSRIKDLNHTAFELSGGLDSSSIVSLLCQDEEAKNIDTYSMSFNGMSCDEGEYIESMLKKYALNHQKILTSNLDYKNTFSLHKLYKLSPNWPINLTLAMSIPMYQKMKQDGKHIIITGQGGDHLFTGSPYMLYELFKRFKFLSLYNELKLYPKQWATIKSYIIKPLLGNKILNIMKQFRSKSIPCPFLQNNTDIQELSEKLKLKNTLFKDDLDMITSSFYSTVMDGNVFHCVEKNFDIKFHHPYLDIDLIEFVLSLPPEMKYKNRTIKWILRKTMDGILPDKIRHRKDKAEFSQLIYQQINAIDLNMILKDSRIVQLGLIEQSIINKHINDYENKKTKYILILWSIINMEYWYRYNFEPDSLKEVL